MSSTDTRRRRGILGTAAVLAVAIVATFALAPIGGRASSHREAPLVSADPQVDTTDTYAFRSPDNPNTVTLISTWIPFQEPAGGPNFYAFAENVDYDFNIDNDGDAQPDLIYRFEFTNHYRNEDTFLYNTGQVTTLTDTDLNFFQTYDLKLIPEVGGTELLLNDAIAAPSRVGNASMPAYGNLRKQAIRKFDAGQSKAFAGQADDPFFLDLRVFDLLYGTNLSEVGDDTLDGFNVNALAVQVPRMKVAKNNEVGNNPIIGVWATASRPSIRTQADDGSQVYSGSNVQVSRLGMPLVNEVVIPVGDKDKWNASEPVNDLANFGGYVTEPELPELMQAVYGIPAPDTCGGPTPPRCRTDLVQVFVTGIPGLNQPSGVVPSEMIRLNMTTPLCSGSGCNRLGVIGGDSAGYPNGRRLWDDTIDISLQVVEGELVGSPNSLGDGVNVNDRPFLGAFPFVALPWSGSDPDPH